MPTGAINLRATSATPRPAPTFSNSFACCTKVACTMPTGVVKKFFEDKGFGFITPDEGGEEIFVHRKIHGADRTAYLEEGAKVQFEKQWEDQKGKWSCSSCDGINGEEVWKSGGGGG